MGTTREDQEKILNERLGSLKFYLERIDAQQKDVWSSEASSLQLMITDSIGKKFKDPTINFDQKMILLESTILVMKSILLWDENKSPIGKSEDLTKIIEQLNSNKLALKKITEHKFLQTNPLVQAMKDLIKEMSNFNEAILNNKTPSQPTPWKRENK